MHQQLQSQPENHADFTCRNGILYHKNRIVISSKSALKNALLDEFHTSPMGGHTGISKTYSRLPANVTWKGIKKDVIDYTAKCSV